MPITTDKLRDCLEAQHDALLSAGCSDTGMLAALEEAGVPELIEALQAMMQGNVWGIPTWRDFPVFGWVDIVRPARSALTMAREALIKAGAL